MKKFISLLCALTMMISVSAAPVVQAKNMPKNPKVSQFQLTEKAPMGKTIAPMSRQDLSKVTKVQAGQQTIKAPMVKKVAPQFNLKRAAANISKPNRAVKADTTMAPEYDVADAIAAVDAGAIVDGDDIAVHGIITKMQIKGKNFAKYGSVCIYVKDANGNEGEFEFFNCLSFDADTFKVTVPEYDATSTAWINLESVTDVNGVTFKIGDEVVARGNFKLYNGTYELNQGCQIIYLKIDEPTEKTREEAIEVSMATGLTYYTAEGYWEVVAVNADYSRYISLYGFNNAIDGSYDASNLEGFVAYTYIDSIGNLQVSEYFDMVDANIQVTLNEEGTRATIEGTMLCRSENDPTDLPEFSFGFRPNVFIEEPEVVPTIEDLAAQFDVTNNIVLAAKFDEQVCNDVVFVGSFNGWDVSDPASLPHFAPLAGFDGWYAVEVPFEEGAQGKPVQLLADGTFSWDFQTGDVNAWIHVGGNAANIVAGYEGESNIEYPAAGAYIYEIAYWKNHNIPCEVQRYNFTINMYAPTACPEMKPAIIGSFNNWEAGVPLEEVEEGLFRITVNDIPGGQFKFKEVNDTDWTNELLWWYDGDSINEAGWYYLGNLAWPSDATEDMEFWLDYSDNSQYRFALCEPEEPNYDATDEDFAADFAEYTVTDRGNGLVRVVGWNENNDYLVLWMQLADSTASELAPGVYPVLNSGEPQSTYIGFVENNTIYGSFANHLIQNEDSSYYYGDPFWFFAEGNVIVNEDLSITVDALNWYGRTIQANLAGKAPEPDYDATDVDFVADFSEYNINDYYAADYGVLFLTGWNENNEYLRIELVLPEGATELVPGVYPVTSDGEPQTAYIGGYENGVFGSFADVVFEQDGSWYYSLPFWFFADGIVTVNEDLSINVDVINTHGRAIKAFMAEPVKPVQVLTVAEAIALGETLADNESTTESYIVRGYVANAYAYNTTYGNQTFFMSDDPNATRGDFEAYRCVLDSPGVVVGDIVDVYGPITRYVNASGSAIVEINGGTVDIIGHKAEPEWSQCGDSLYWSIDEAGVLSIEGTGAMWDNMYETWDCSAITALSLPEGLTSIGQYAFYGATNLKEVNLPSTLTYIDFAAFAETGLQSLLIPANVQILGQYAFAYCYDLVVVQALGRTDIYGNTFTGSYICALAAPLWFFHGIDSRYIQILYVTAGYPYADYFEKIRLSRHYLTTLDLSGLEGNYIPAEAFRNCYNLERVVLPAGVQVIEQGAFQECKMLSDIVFPAGLTEIGPSAFEDCRSLTALNFEAGSQLWRVSNWAFYNCHNLRSIALPEGVTYIGDGAFYGCVYAETMELPASVVTIGDNAFALCTRLNKMEVNAVLPPAIVDKTFFEVSREAPVYVPDESVDIYKQDRLWNELNIIGRSQMPHGIDNVNAGEKVQKVLRDGQLLLIRGERTFTTTGVEVK